MLRFIAVLVCLSVSVVQTDGQVIVSAMRHLRIEGQREWAEYSETPDGSQIDVSFEADANAEEWALRIRQVDVKQQWFVQLNGERIGELTRDENDMVIVLAVPKETVRQGENRLSVFQSERSTDVDDIRVGEVELIQSSAGDYLSQAPVIVRVVESGTKAPIPARITILNSDGALQSVGAESNNHMAVRSGTIYTSNGKAEFGLPPGEYSIYAGRGLEYSLGTTKVSVAKGLQSTVTIAIERQVPTEGYVACDTHVHTRTHSGHGDSTVLERMITIAGEGIELPIATDHNVQINHDPFARQMNVRQYFTPVIGNEVTTKSGHFNIWPVAEDADLPDYKSADWADTFASIQQTTAAPVVILNHARDIHSGVRPFGPAHHNEAVAENRDGWPFEFTGMELINSGATQTDQMQLLRDWMELLNRGLNVTPVGCSDSHDVARHFIGQGRTYIACDDSDPGNIDVDEAVESFLAGRVSVSYGLLTELTVNDRRPGDVVSAAREYLVQVRILAPEWIDADRVQLFANGQMIREVKLSGKDTDQPGVKWRGEWRLSDLKHDVHLVAVASGPGIDRSYWKTAKPYQPTSPEWTARVLGMTGAVKLDADGDGKWSSARDYAEQLVGRSKGDAKVLAETLADVDQAVAAHSAHVLLRDHEVAPVKLLQQAALGKSARAGITAFINATEKCRLASEP